MAGFEPRISGVGSDCSTTNCDTTTARLCDLAPDEIVTVAKYLKKRGP